MPHPPQIPLTPQTDERNFPRWEAKAGPGKSGHPYPKMLTKTCTQDDRDRQRKKTQRMDRQDGAYWDEPPLRVGAPIPLLSTQEMVDAGKADTIGEPVYVNSESEERELLVFLGLAEPLPPPRAMPIPIAAPREDYEAPKLVVKRRHRRTKAQMAAARAQSKSEIVEELD